MCAGHASCKAGKCRESLPTAWRQLAMTPVDIEMIQDVLLSHVACLSTLSRACEVCRYSIHARDHAELKEAVARYPEPVEGAQGVYYCGYNSERSFGGSAWLIQRESGNVLVDSPRFDPKLVRNIKVKPLS